MTATLVRTRAWVVLAGLILAVSGCSAEALPPEEFDVEASEVSPRVTPEETIESLPPEVLPCDVETQEAVEAIILAQSTALGAGDFETAYTFASPAFRAGVDLPSFERVITRQYDMLVYFEGGRFGLCEIIGDGLVQLNVEITSSFYQPVAMVYEMVFAEGQWWVSAVENPVSAIPNA